MRWSVVNWRENQNVSCSRLRFNVKNVQLLLSLPNERARAQKGHAAQVFGICVVFATGWGAMLPEMGEHQLMMGDYLRHSNLHVTNKISATRRKANGCHKTN